MYQKYKVIVSNGRADFERDVNIYLEAGYKLVGGVSVTEATGWPAFMYVQAVIKDE